MRRLGRELVCISVIHCELIVISYYYIVAFQFDECFTELLLMDLQLSMLSTYINKTINHNSFNVNSVTGYLRALSQNCCLLHHRRQQNTLPNPISSAKVQKNGSLDMLKDLVQSENLSSSPSEHCCGGCGGPIRDRYVDDTCQVCIAKENAHLDMKMLSYLNA